MDIVKIQSLIGQGKVVTLSDIDPTQSFIQVGVYQQGNRKIRPGDPNTYAPFTIPVSELAPENIYTPYILYVDDTAGNNATAEKGYPSKPYATIDAATADASFGDIIKVERGGYYISSIKPNVTYYLGASNIVCGNLITNAYGSGTFRVYGNAYITCYGSLVSNIVDSTVYFNCTLINYFSSCINGNIYNSQINITTDYFQGLAQYAFAAYLDTSSTNVVINITSDKYIFPRGFIGWFTGNNPITINIHGRELIHTGPDSYASLAWPLGDGTTINFYVENVIINAVGFNAFFPGAGKLNVYSKITCNSSTSWIMADGGISTFYGDIDAGTGYLYVRGTGATVIIRQANLLTSRLGNAVEVNGSLLLYDSTFKSTDSGTGNGLIEFGNAAGMVMLNNSKIITLGFKPCIRSTLAGPNSVQVYGSCYSVVAPINITQAPETIIQYAGLQ